MKVDELVGLTNRAQAITILAQSSDIPEVTPEIKQLYAAAEQALRQAMVKLGNELAKKKVG